MMCNKCIMPLLSYIVVFFNNSHIFTEYFFVYKTEVAHLDMEDTDARCNTTIDDIDFGSCLNNAAEHIMNCSIPVWGDDGRSYNIIICEFELNVCISKIRIYY